MTGKIIDKTSIEATIAFSDGSTATVASSCLPCNFKVGDAVNTEPYHKNMTGKTFINISFPPIC